MMRKLAGVIISAVAFMSVMAGPAAASSVAGPYETLKVCEKARAKYSVKYKTKPCTYLFPIGYYFQYG